MRRGRRCGPSARRDRQVAGRREGRIPHSSAYLPGCDRCASPTRHARLAPLPPVFRLDRTRDARLAHRSADHRGRRQLASEDPLLCPGERTEPHLRLDTSPPPPHATPPRGQHSEEPWEDPVGAALVANCAASFRKGGGAGRRAGQRAARGEGRVAPHGLSQTDRRIASIIPGIQQSSPDVRAYGQDRGRPATEHRMRHPVSAQNRLGLPGV